MPDAETGAIRVASPAGRWVVLTTVLGSSMALLDSTVINVALPRIGKDLGTDLAALQWTVNAYMLTLAGLILLGGALGDRFGRRRVFVVGIVWFAAASVMCGVAPNAVVLISARALQGIGGALLTPGSLALIQASFHPDDRARAVGLWSGFGGIGAAVGPFVGGWLVDGPGWRWVFLLNVPLAAICVPVALRHVPESRDPHAHGRFDVLGAVLAALALALVTYALIEAPGRGVSGVVLGTAVAGVALGAVFVRVERRRRNPMLPPSVFASRQFTVVNVITLCVYAALGGFFFLSAIQLQVVAGYSALGAGTALLPMTLLMLIFSASSGELGQRIGPRIPLGVGPLVAATGMLLMLRVRPGAHSVSAYLTDVLPAVAVLGAGMVTLVAPLTATVLASVDTARAGLASGINNAAARAAGLIAVAALPLLAGMGPEAYRNAEEFAVTFRRAMPMCAGLLVLGSLIAWAAVRNPPVPAAEREAEGKGEPQGRRVGWWKDWTGWRKGRGRVRPKGRVRPECAVHCGVVAPPLEPAREESAREESAHDESAHEEPVQPVHGEPAREQPARDESARGKGAGGPGDAGGAGGAGRHST
ncbi:MFS transporter [Streptomyces sp. NPDC002164]|uniref:MFS transporter n=1 Tax=Streptomyces sp. NPDC002164 TaxID=3364633 RepID=UPI0036A6C80C